MPLEAQQRARYRPDKRFQPGNQMSKGASGNKLAGRRSALRSLLMKTCTDEDFKKVVSAMIKKAQAGEPVAMREFFAQMLGPQEVNVNVEERPTRLKIILVGAASYLKKREEERMALENQNPIDLVPVLPALPAPEKVAAPTVDEFDDIFGEPNART